MPAANNLAKEQRKKKAKDDGKIVFHPYLKSTIESITAKSSRSDPKQDALDTSPLLPIASGLLGLARLPSGPAQTDALKDLLATMLPVIFDSSSPVALSQAEILVELTLAAGTRPLHRPILAALKAAPPPTLSAVHAYVAARLQADSILVLNAQSNKSTAEVVSEDSSGGMPSDGSIGDALRVMHAVDSLIIFPEHHSAVAPAILPLTRLAALTLRGAVDRVTLILAKNSTPGFAAIEEVSDTVGHLYSLLSHFGGQLPSSMAQPEGISAAEVVTDVAGCLLEVLSSGWLSKENLASAAVTLLAAAALPFSNEDSSISLKPTYGHVVAHLARGLLGAPTNLGTGPPLEEKDSSLLGCHAVDNATATCSQGWVCNTLLKRRHASFELRLYGLPLLAQLSVVRGMLQSTPLSVLTMPLRVPHTQTHQGKAWDVLVDGVVFSMCRVIGTSPDPMVKYHALYTLSICLERMNQHVSHILGMDGMKHRSTAGGRSESYKHATAWMSEQAQSTVLRALWANWDEPEPSLVRVAHAAFDHLLALVELQAGLSSTALGNGLPSHTSPPPLVSSAFLERVAKDLLSIAPERKGRYGPLASVVQRLGASAMLGLRPGLVTETLHAMASNGAACSPGATMLGALWRSAKQELQQQHAGPPFSCTSVMYLLSDESIWLYPLEQALCEAEREDDAWERKFDGCFCEEETENKKGDALRKAVCTYAVPALVEVHPGALLVLVGRVHAAGATAGLVELLSMGRKLNVIGDLDDQVLSGAVTGRTHAMLRLLRTAVLHDSESLRGAALQLVCVHPRASALPTAVELSIVEQALNGIMRTTSASLRQRCLPPLGRLLARMRTAVGAMLTRPKDFTTSKGTSIESELSRCERWLQRLSAGLVMSAYPGAQYGRRFMAMELLCMFLEVFGDLVSVQAMEMPMTPFAKKRRIGGERRKGPQGAVRKGDGSAGLKLVPSAFRPFFNGFLSPNTINTLLLCVCDSWDRVRDAASEALLLLPPPLPGLETPESVEELLSWSFTLLRSPRLKEADAGARVLLIVFEHYVRALGWQVHLHGTNDDVPRVMETQGQVPLGATIAFFDSLVHLIDRQVAKGERDLETAAKESLAHGLLLALRYIIPVLPWGDIVADADATKAARNSIFALLSTLHRLTELTLPLLSAPEEMTRLSAMDVDSGMDTSGLDVYGNDEGGEQNGSLDPLGPTAQVVTCACWMTAKEAALVLGTLCQAALVVPMHGGQQRGTQAGQSGAVLVDAASLKNAADDLVRFLLEAKHNGAVDKTQQGLEAVSTAFLECSDLSLSCLPGQWMERVMAHLLRRGQTRRDIIRRSAGLPYAMQALLRARPAGGIRVLASRGLNTLLDIASGKEIHGVHEPWARVHAFNALRLAFADAQMGRETAVFHARGLVTCIEALSASEWEVRNAATLCYTALLVRVMGFANVTTRDAAAGRRSPTASEFFAAHPTLHSYLLKQLTRAVDGLDSASTQSPGPSHLLLGDDEIAPSLAPILALLMRLKPDITVSSTFSASGSGDEGAEMMIGLLPYPPEAPGVVPEGSHYNNNNINEPSPSAFVPVLRRCAAARAIAVRQLAGKALVPLLDATSAPAVAAALAADISRCLQRSVPAGENGANREDLPKHSADLGGSSNAVHGMLLQLEVLLDASSPGKKGSKAGNPFVAEAVASTFQNSSGCISAVCDVGRYACVPISHAMLRVMSALGRAHAPRRLFKESQDTVVEAASNIAWESSLRLASENHEDGGDEIGLVEPPMLGVAMKEATMLRLLWGAHPTLHADVTQSTQADDTSASEGKWRWVEDVSMAVDHPRVEVRAAAFKCAIRTLETGGLNGVKAEDLRVLEALRQVIGIYLSTNWTKKDKGTHEGKKDPFSHPKVLRRALHLLSLLMTRAPEGENFDEALFGIVAEVAQHAREPATRCHALVCLGAFSPSLHPSLQYTLSDMARCIADMALECSAPSQLPEVRLATARMLTGRGAGMVLSPDNSMASPSLITSASALAWSAVLKLLEDEDADVRRAAALIVRCYGSENMFSPQADHDVLLRKADETGDKRNTGRTGAVPLCDEAVGRLLPMDLVTSLGNAGDGESAVLEMLQRVVCDHDTLGNVLADVRSSAPQQTQHHSDGPSGRLFDREAENQHAEPLLTAQIAAHALAHAFAAVRTTDGRMTQPSSAWIVQSAVDWGLPAADILKQRLSALKSCNNVWGLQINLGEGEAFVSTYRLMLALWTVGHLGLQRDPSSPNVQALFTEIEEIDAIFNEDGHHPLLDAAWKATIRKWSSDGACNDGDDVAWSPMGFLVDILCSERDLDDDVENEGIYSDWT